MVARGKPPPASARIVTAAAATSFRNPNANPMTHAHLKPLTLYRAPDVVSHDVRWWGLIVRCAQCKRRLRKATGKRRIYVCLRCGIEWTLDE